MLCPVCGAQFEKSLTVKGKEVCPSCGCVVSDQHQELVLNKVHDRSKIAITFSIIAIACKLFYLFYELFYFDATFDFHSILSLCSVILPATFILFASSIKNKKATITITCVLVGVLLIYYIVGYMEVISSPLRYHFYYLTYIIGSVLIIVFCISKKKIFGVISNSVIVLYSIYDVYDNIRWFRFEFDLSYFLWCFYGLASIFAHAALFIGLYFFIRHIIQLSKYIEGESSIRSNLN